MCIHICLVFFFSGGRHAADRAAADRGGRLVPPLRGVIIVIIVT